MSGRSLDAAQGQRSFAEIGKYRSHAIWAASRCGRTHDHSETGLENLRASYKNSGLDPFETAFNFTVMQLLPAFIALLAASGAYAQTSCAFVVSDVARQVTEMQNFNNRVPPPSSTNRSDCTTAKTLKSGIDAYRNALISDPASGCITVYATTILSSGVFNPQYSLLGKFVAACGSL
ncbi:hypothetical protein C8R47DRAFT_515412 [Mycena vitilis]|nr:hypothetical protein C8R47DRAFT_515412 [Mycena vitilis]